MASESLSQTLRETLNVFDTVGEPLPTTDVAERLNIDRQSALTLLEQLVEKGHLEMKTVGERGRVWWRPVTAPSQRAPLRMGEHVSREQFGVLIDAVEEYAIFALDADGTVQTWNTGAERIKGFQTEDILGEHFSTFYTEEDRIEGVPARNLRAAVNDGSLEDEGWRVRADGSQFWANVTITAVRDETGELTGFVKVTRDMTERREHEQQLERLSARTARRKEELESELDDVLERVSHGFYALDENLHFGYINEHARDLLGLDEASVGADIREAITLTDDFEAALIEALETQEPVELEDYYTPVGEWYYNAIYPSETGLSVYFQQITESKAREEELERYAAILDAIGEPVYELDTEGCIVFHNDALVEYLGCDGSEVIGEHVSLFMEDEAIEDVEARIKSLLEAPESRNEKAEFDVFPRDGDPIPVENRFSLLTDEAGCMRGTAGMLWDISERKQRERRLEEYRTILETIPDGAYIADVDQRLQFVSDAFVEMTGYSREELIGAHISFIGTDSGVEQSQRQREELTAGERTMGTIDDVIHTADGQIISAETRFTKLDDDGDFRGTAGTVRDITSRKARERELERRARQQEVIGELGQSALEESDLDHLMITAAGSVTGVLDAAVCQIVELGVITTDPTIRHSRGWDVSKAVSLEAAECVVPDTLETEEPLMITDLSRDRRFSDEDWVDDHGLATAISVIIGSFDEPWGTLTIYGTEQREFTAFEVNFVQSVGNILAGAIEREAYRENLVQLVRDLEESNERLEQFAYAASHDLQEPLRMVSSYLQLIERRYGEDLTDEAREFFAFATDGADRMRAMIDGLLAYSRVETEGKAFEAVDLNAVVAQVRDDLALRIDERDAEIDIDDLPTVLGDDHQLQQVFQNLLRNAIQYSGDAPPEIAVRAEQNGSMWTITVEDNGIGIDPAYHQQIFDVFQRLAPDSAPGSGIGLALCDRIIERHGGEIWVDSAPGTGATFGFTLPAPEAQ